MKQKVTVTISFTVDEEDENTNYDYAHEIAGSMYDIALSEDYKAKIEVDLN
jgi:hypothetical protein